MFRDSVAFATIALPFFALMMIDMGKAGWLSFPIAILCCAIALAMMLVGFHYIGRTD